MAQIVLVWPQVSRRTLKPDCATWPGQVPMQKLLLRPDGSYWISMASSEWYAWSNPGEIRPRLLL